MELILILTLAVVIVAVFMGKRQAEAHCDTLSGPVIKAALIASEQQDVAPVRKWIRPEDEPEIREAFDLSCYVRNLGPDARKLAERAFFETLIRVHRMGEGASYEGIKPDSSVPPVVAKADEALESGDVSDLANRISNHVKQTVEKRFQHAWEKKQSAEESPEKGRDFVKAYISFVHYVEGIHAMTMKGHAHGEHHH